MEFYSRHRSREKITKWHADNYFAGSPTGPLDGQFIERQETYDEPHAWRSFQKLKHSNKEFGRLDMGGPFLTKKWVYQYDPLWLDIDKLGFYGYRGPQFAAKGGATPDVTVDAYLSLNPSEDQTLDAMGTTAISRVSPTNPHAQAFTAMVELYRDGLPSAIGVNAIKRQDLGGEYLNVAFGILPTMSDIKSIASSYRNADRLLAQYYRDSGRVVRRKYEFPTEITVVEDTTTHGTVPVPVLPSSLYNSTANSKLRKVVTRYKKTWFSGAFTYHAQPPNSVSAIRDQIEKYDYLYGMNPTLEGLWNVLPYSWAADWMSNMGDVLNNLQMFQQDGLVMLWGYVMEHQMVTTEYTCSGADIWSVGPISTMQRFIVETKRRRRATPFGFGLELDGFTDRQWAILAALGLSRGRGALAY